MTDPTEAPKTGTQAKWFWIAAIVLLLVLLVYLFVNPTQDAEEVVDEAAMPADQVELDPVDPVDESAVPPVTLPEAGALDDGRVNEGAAE